MINELKRAQQNNRSKGFLVSWLPLNGGTTEDQDAWIQRIARLANQEEQKRDFIIHGML